jgi:hypothetical protein
MIYTPDIPTSYIETVTVKTTTLVQSSAVYAKDLLEDIDRVRYRFV